VALTGYAGLEDQRRAREAGFDAHMTKPADLDELIALVRRLAARSASASSSAPRPGSASGADRASGAGSETPS
jgi:ATP-binding cassette subfamily B protein